MLLPTETTPLPVDIVNGYQSNSRGPRLPTGVERKTSLISDYAADENESSSADSAFHLNSIGETFLTIVKGYFGAGCLSLPWAVSVLGVPWGITAIFALSFITTYSSFSIVELRRYIEQSRQVPGRPNGLAENTNTNNDNGDNDDDDDDGEDNDNNDDDENSTSMASSMASVASTRTSITYPDVGEWAYGKKFQKYVRMCICVLQLAVCTVFVSFVGENILAVLVRLHVPGATHWSVMLMELPIILALAMIPSLKLLAPVNAIGTILLIVCFAAIGVVMQQKWNDRPEELPPVQPSSFPLALCAILYSYEGICLVLPVESAMKEPEKFKTVFFSAMSVVALVLATFSTSCVYVFGNVTNGSMTAFLVETYKDDATTTFWLMVANTAVSLSVLLTYPLTIFPALELLAEWVTQRSSSSSLSFFDQLSKRRDSLLGDDEEDELAAFEPLPPLPEHDVASIGDDPTTPMEHTYGVVEEEGPGDDTKDEVESFSGVSSVTSRMPQMTIPGDSLQLRASLVLLTFFFAVAVPNVQALISLVGALAGSSIALLIPPILELAWIREMEQNPAVGVGVDIIPNHFWMLAPASSSWGRFWIERCKCYFLLMFGMAFLCLGTYFSVMDIVRIYLGTS